MTPTNFCAIILQSDESHLLSAFKSWGFEEFVGIKVPVIRDNILEYV